MAHTIYKREKEDLQKESLKIEVLQQQYETTKLESVILWTEAAVYYISDLEHICLQKDRSISDLYTR